MTFSIVATCRRTGQFGVGATTEMPAVGQLLSWAFPGAGAVATQALVNPYLGIDGISLLRKRTGARAALDELIGRDERARQRQLALIDRDGLTAVWTGEDCLHWAGSVQGDGFSAQGNRLRGPQVVEAMAEAFEATDGGAIGLPNRLMAALVAGDRAGGDRKGERSANILVVESEEYPLWDIRVDDHPRPMEELARLHAVFETDLLPHIRRMPRRDHFQGDADDFSI